MDHITDVTILRGEVEGLRLDAHVNRREHEAAMERVAAVGKDRPTIERARRQARPDLAESIDGAKWLVARCGEQIERLDREYDAASRCYTIMTGG